ncbi:MAG: hypothetical protein ABSA06_12120 [Geobacteraceae bacterium]
MARSRARSAFGDISQQRTGVGLAACSYAPPRRETAHLLEVARTSPGFGGRATFGRVGSRGGPKAGALILP